MTVTRTEAGSICSLKRYVPPKLFFPGMSLDGLPGNQCAVSHRLTLLAAAHLVNGSLTSSSVGVFCAMTPEPRAVASLHTRIAEMPMMRAMNVGLSSHVLTWTNSFGSYA